LPSSGSDLAAIIYTSGSTGNPKGVTLSHANLAANVASILAYLKLTPADRTVSVLPFHYSYGNSVLHTHLAAGACLVIENNLLYPHRVVERMVSSGATGFAGVPSTYALLLNRVALDKYDLRSLKHVTQAGGPMTPALTQRLVAALPHTRVFVMYGQTEASARLTYLPPERLQEKLGTVGIPIRDVTLEIRDESGARCKPGVTGEVCARGPNIMVGYWQDEVATRAVLKDGWLATGDLGFLDEDGFLHLVARKTEMIKTGAHRVSPNDIEEALAALDGVEESAAIGVPDELLGQVVKVFVVARRGCTVAESDIRRHCQRQLAQYKVPKHVEFIDSLPRGAGGKLQRFRLLERK
jgi:long-chain acyl-CoA synthetase